MNLNTLAGEVHSIAVNKGWYDTPRGVPELIALMHSELSEALEDYRDHDIGPTGMRTEDGKPEGIAVEFADTIIRILDACAFLGLDIDAALAAKMAYNRTREYRHGGKLA